VLSIRNNLGPGKISATCQGERFTLSSKGISSQYDLVFLAPKSRYLSPFLRFREIFAVRTHHAATGTLSPNLRFATRFLVHSCCSLSPFGRALRSLAFWLVWRQGPAAQFCGWHKLFWYSLQGPQYSGGSSETGKHNPCPYRELYGISRNSFPVFNDPRVLGDLFWVGFSRDFSDIYKSGSVRFLLNMLIVKNLRSTFNHNLICAQVRG